MDANLALSNLSRLLVGLLARFGVEDIVVSPGSRSTPYLAATLERKQLRTHLVVDERSAGYVALGLARARRRPVALLCTSGTAAANYLPAVVEASLTETPLVVLTADRPLSLQGCSAPQTIDQTRLFGNHVLVATSLTVPCGSHDEFIRARRQILSTLAHGQGMVRGPVHINLHTPKPLELVVAETAEQRATEAFIESLIGATARPAPPSPVLLSERAVEGLLAAISAESRGLITCGFDPDRTALDPCALTRFARATGYPVLLDAAHPLRFDAPPELLPYLVAPFEPLLQIEHWRLRQAPKIVVQIGRPLTSNAFERWMVESDHGTSFGKVLLLARSGWPDPTGVAELLGHGDPSDALRRVSAALESEAPRSSGWAARWFRAAGIVQACIAEFAHPAQGQGELGELHAVLSVLSAQPTGARLILGNSLPIREVDLLATPNLPRIFAEAHRGASGIDGLVSMTAGFALSEERPTTLLLGDISFLHDIGGLWAMGPLASPLAIVVLNNGGGRIFEQLPIAKSVSADALAYWTTPQKLDLSAAAQVYGLSYCRAERASTLSSAIAEAHAKPGATLIEAVVSPHSASRQSSELIALVRAALFRAGLSSEAIGA